MRCVGFRIAVVLFIACLVRSADAQEQPGNAAAAAGGGATAKVVALPAPADAVVPAGGGRYLLLQMNKLLKVAVFDVTQDKIIGYAPMSSTDTLIAGGATKMVMVARDKGVVQRWSLDPLKKELTIALGVEGEVDGAVMGHASEGPLLVMTRQGPRFLDLRSLKPISVGGTEGRGGDWHPHPQYPIHVAASADGQTFAGWTRGLSPSGVRVLQLQPGKLVGAYAHDSAGVLLPSHDGSLLFTSAGIYSVDLKRIAPDQFNNKTCLPSYHPSYFLAVDRSQPIPGRGQEARAPGAAIYTTGDRALLVELDPLPELGQQPEAGFGGADPLGLHQRVFLIPQHDRLVLVGETRDKLHVRPFDLIAALDKVGIDYLFVDTLPVTTAEPGEPYRYPIAVRSKAGGVKFTLDSGPEGMRLDEDGMLAWTVPQDHEGGPVGIIITVEDASGQSIFHTFNVTVAPAKGAPEEAGAAAPGGNPPAGGDLTTRSGTN